MLKTAFTCVLLCAIIHSGLSQTSIKQSGYVYHPPAEDKLSWQRLNLWLGSIYYWHSLSGETMDSCIIYASRSLGLSRLPITAENISNTGLPEQSQWYDDRNPKKGLELLKQAKGKNHLQLLILLGSYYTFESESSKLYKDSVEYYLKNAVSESKALKEKRLGRVATCLLGKFYLQAGELNTGDSVFNQLTSECQAEGDKEIMARVLAYRGRYTVRQRGTPPTTALFHETMQLKIDYLTKAAALYHSLNDIENEIVALTNIGNFRMLLGQYDDAHQDFLKVLQLEKEIGYPYTHYTTANIALTGTLIGKFGEPLKYARETVQIAEAAKDSIGWGTFYSSLATIMQTDEGNMDESLKWMQKSLDQYVITKSPKSYDQLANLSTLMTESGDKAKEMLDLITTVTEKIPPTEPDHIITINVARALCYSGLKQYKLAEQYALSADSIIKTYAYQSSYIDYKKAMVNSTLADIYYYSGQFVKAKKYFEGIVADSNRLIVTGSEKVTYEHLIKLDSIFNDPVSAVMHYKTYVELIDSNFRASKIRQAEELAVMYETKEKQDSISLLNEQGKVEKANLKQATLIRNVTIAGIIGALIIALLLYRQSRLRKLNNKVVTDKNVQLEHLLTEKERLVKEIHHRVKNNLQIIMSLLGSQSIYSDNDAARNAIHDSQNRINAMSLIHQRLYGSEGIPSIDISVYIRELVSYLGDSYDASQRIRFDYNIQPLEMEVSQAVPLGLILNEAITNSLKYAFPEDKRGQIAVSLSTTSENRYLLSISDNGIGMPPGPIKTGSMGMSLMRGLSADLDGSFSIENNNGTTVKISFQRRPV